MATQSLHEPLTDREQEILALLSDDLTNAEIAQRLVLAVSTVKWHLRNIYGKLGVQNRSEAVTYARQLGLLQTRLAGIRSTHNLPAPSTRFIGRTTELAEIGQLLEVPSTRLVTILGLGGMGKTRLALRCAEAQIPHFPNGVFYVPLAPLRAARDSLPNKTTTIANAIANALSLTLYSANEIQHSVLEVLRQKTALLVIDNCEHLLDGISFLSDILAFAPQVKILATSRERLRLSGESVFNLSGLKFPDHPTPDAIQYPAVKLFIDAARRTHRLAEPGIDDLKHIMRICQFVDGMPLGIELAAGWSHLLSVEEIAREIEHDLDFLATDQADVPPRLRSARAVFNYTWTRLTDAERAAFMKLSIFRGGFTRQAAQAVTGVTLKTLSGLVDHSLLWRSSLNRYGVQELLRQFAEEHLESSHEMEPTLDAHSYYYLAFLSQREEDIKGRRQLAGLDEIEADFENIKGAWDRALSREFYEALYPTAEALLWFCSMRGYPMAGLNLFRQAEAWIDPSQNEDVERLWARLMLRGIRLRIILKDYSNVQEDLALCYEIVQHQADPSDLACCLWLQGNIENHTHDSQASLPCYEQSFELYQQLNDQFYMAQLSFHLSYTYQSVGEPIEVLLKYARQSLYLMRQLGNKAWTIWPLNILGRTSLKLGEAATAEQYFREAYNTCLEFNNAIGTAWAANALSHPFLWGDDLQGVRRLAQEAFTIATDLNHPGTLSPAMSNLGYLALIDGEYARSEQLLWQALPLAEYHWSTSNIYRGLGFLMCAQDRFADARAHLVDALKFLDQPDHAVMTMIPLITLATFILAHQDDRERAVEWLGCADSAANDTVRWLQKLAFIASLYEELEADLGSEIYTAAWERGKQLELETVWADLQTQIEKWE